MKNMEKHTHYTIKGNRSYLEKIIHILIKNGISFAYDRHSKFLEFILDEGFGLQIHELIEAVPSSSKGWDIVSEYEVVKDFSLIAFA